ncbi:hypothetical protein [Vibrio lentus]|uniref:hypothetical protein n=2 Tax=Vibrio lentus TaxID=136468 RepID=UPI00178C9EA0|nr:hypothetical protein [Vibrio lentus]MDN3630542.1 hypothetical protein [Vibrio lentus]
MLNDVSLYLHVGLHKTGSSAVQSYFLKNYNENIKCGLLFPKFGFENTEYKGGRKGTTSGHNELIRVISSKNNKTKEKFIDGIRSEAKNKKINKVFIGSSKPPPRAVVIVPLGYSLKKCPC